jgi:hypothetical protein
MIQKSYFKDFELNSANSAKVKSLFIAKKTKGMWQFIDSLNLCDYKNREVELVFQRDNALVRVWLI